MKNSKNSKAKMFFKEFLILFFLTLILFNFLQTFQGNWKSYRGIVYLFGYFLVFITWCYAIYVSIRKRGLLFKIYKKFILLNIPKGAKIAIVIVFIGNFITIGFAKSYYPFYDVGMFRWSSKFSNPEKILYSPKYYFIKDSQIHILELRKEGFYFLSDYLGWGYTPEFTFATRFHNRGQKENFEYISRLMKERGIDTLWMGIHQLDYTTGEVIFIKDICKAISINQNKKILYGPLYVPHYQLDKCKTNE